MGLVALRTKRERVKQNPDQVTGRVFCFLPMITIDERNLIIVDGELNGMLKMGLKYFDPMWRDVKTAIIYVVFDW